jgi:mono/diheme cytochrome c family protein
MNKIFRIASVGLLSLVFVGDGMAEKPSRRPTDVELGNTLYMRHCAACHGVGGRGGGPASLDIVGGIPNLRGKVRRNRATSNRVLVGMGAMPAFGNSLTREEVSSVLGHMAGLGNKGGQHKRGKSPPKKEVLLDNNEEPTPPQN